MTAALSEAGRAALMWAQENVRFGSVWRVTSSDGGSSVRFVVGAYFGLSRPEGCAVGVIEAEDNGPASWFWDALVRPREKVALPVLTMKQWLDAGILRRA